MFVTVMNVWIVWVGVREWARGHAHATSGGAARSALDEFSGGG